MIDIICFTNLFIKINIYIIYTKIFNKKIYFIYINVLFLFLKKIFFFIIFLKNYFILIYIK